MDPYPSNWFVPQRLRQLLGNFWEDCATTNQVLDSLLAGRYAVDLSLRRQIEALYASLVRQHTLPYTPRDAWPLRLHQPAATTAAPAVSLNYSDPAEARYGDPNIVYGRPPAACTVSIDPAWRRLPLLVDHFDAPRHVWVEGVDYTYTPGSIHFQRDPWASGQLTSSTAWVFALGGDYEQQQFWQQWAYPFQVPVVSYSEALRAWTEALWRLLLEGPSELGLRCLLAALADVACAQQEGTVEAILPWQGAHWLVIGQQLYYLAPGQQPAVSVGQHVAAGTFLAQTLTWWDCGQHPNQAPSWLPVLAVGPEYLGSDFPGELLWPNQLLPTQVSEGPWTELRLALGGHPGAVETFWQQVQARGITQQQTLAMQLATPDPLATDVQPTAAQLPSAVNPLVFWLTHGWSRAVLVRFLRHQQGPEALPLAYWRWLKHLVPADALLVLVEQQQCSDTCRSETIHETISLWHGQRFSEILTPSSVQETVRLRLLPGWCE